MRVRRLYLCLEVSLLSVSLSATLTHPGKSEPCRTSREFQCTARNRTRCTEHSTTKLRLRYRALGVILDQTWTASDCKKTRRPLPNLQLCDISEPALIVDSGSWLRGTECVVFLRCYRQSVSRHSASCLLWCFSARHGCKDPSLFIIAFLWTQTHLSGLFSSISTCKPATCWMSFFRHTLMCRL